MPKRLPEQDEVPVWRRRIERSKAHRKDQEPVWNNNENSFLGKLYPDEANWNPADPWVCIEKVFSSVRAELPTLLYQNPRWAITPKKPIMEGGVDISWEKARSKELWLQHVWDECQGNKHTRVAIVAAKLALGVAKVGYYPVFADDETRGEFLLDEMGNYVIDGRTGLPALAQGDYARDDDGQIVTDPETGVPLLNPGRLLHERFFVEFVNYRHMLFDPEGGNVFEDSHRFVIEEWVRPLNEVKADPRYKEAVRKGIKANARVGAKPGIDNPTEGLNPFYPSAAPSSSAEAIADDEGRVRGYDIYDLQNRRYLVLADSIENNASNDRYLLDQPMPAWMEHGPYAYLKFNEVPGQWYQKTDIEGMAKVELEYNTTRSQMMRHRNQSRARYLEVEGQAFIDDEQRELFVSGEDGQLVKVRDVNAVQPLRKDALDGSYFQAVPNILQDFNEVSGVPGEARGVADAETATQASILSEGSSIRNSDRRDNQVQQFLAEIGELLLRSGAANADSDLWAKIARPNDPIPFDWQQISPTDLQGEFEIEVAVGSTQPKNSPMRLQMYERILGAIGQYPFLMSSPTLMSRLFETIDLTDPNLIQEIQQIGQQMMQAQTAPTGSDPGAANPMQQIMDMITNQNGESGNSMGGMPTGAPAN